MEVLLFIGIIGLILGGVFKASVGIMKLLLGFVGVVVAIMIIPVAFALLVPLALIGLAVGFLRIIF